eukprot:588162-Hanusia_phi.AAC.2
MDGSTIGLTTNLHNSEKLSDEADWPVTSEADRLKYASSMVGATREVEEEGAEPVGQEREELRGVPESSEDDKEEEEERASARPDWRDRVPTD